MKKNTKESNPGFFSRLIGGKYIKDSAQEILQTGKVLMTPKHIRENAKVETYEEAIARHGVNDETVDKIKKNYTLSFWACFGAFILCFIGILYSLFVTKSLLIGCSYLSIGLMLLANSLRFSFNVYRINHKNLCDFKVFWNNSNEWFPKI